MPKGVNQGALTRCDLSEAGFGTVRGTSLAWGLHDHVECLRLADPSKTFIRHIS